MSDDVQRDGTNPPSFDPPGELGYPAALDTVGTIAAPLLAGFSATLVGLLLDTLQHSVRWPDATVFLLLLSVLAFVATVQLAFNARRYSVTPADLKEWYESGGETYWVKEQLWYRAHYFGWATAARYSYRVGISGFLSGFTLVLVPPGTVSSGRAAVIALASAGAAAELVWIATDILSGARTDRVCVWWWSDVPSALARVSALLGVMMRDGRYLTAWRGAGATLPVICVAGGALLGWHHLDSGVIYMSSTLTVGIAAGAGVMGIALGGWLLLGYACADFAFAHNSLLYSGDLPHRFAIHAGLALAYAVLAMLVMFVPLVAVELSEARATRGERLRNLLLVRPLLVGVLAWIWTQAVPVLVRPFFAWNGSSPPADAVRAMQDGGVWLALVLAGVALLRAGVETALEPRQLVPAAEASRRAAWWGRVPWYLRPVAKAGFSVLLLAGLMTSLPEAVAGVVAVSILLLLIHVAARADAYDRLTRLPMLARFLVGIAVSVLLAWGLVSRIPSTWVLSPPGFLVLLALVILAAILPDGEREPAGAGHAG